MLKIKNMIKLQRRPRPGDMILTVPHELKDALKDVEMMELTVMDDSIVYTPVRV